MEMAMELRLAIENKKQEKAIQNQKKAGEGEQEKKQKEKKEEKCETCDSYVKENSLLKE